MGEEVNERRSGEREGGEVNKLLAGLDSSVET